MHAYYTLLLSLSPYQLVTLTLDGGSFDTTAGDALAVLDELAPGEFFHAAVANARTSSSLERGFNA